MKYILVIDHNRPFVNRIKNILRNESVTFLDDEQKALDLLHKTRCDLIIVSAELNGFNGYILCKHIKENTSLRDIPLIIVSDAPDARSTFAKHEQLKFHADAYGEKNISHEELHKIINSLIPLSSGAKSEDAQLSSHKDIENELIKQKAVNELLIKELNEYREECNFLRKKVARVDEQLDTYSPKRSIMHFRDHFKSHDDVFLQLEKKDREIKNLFDTVSSLRDEIKELEKKYKNEIETVEKDYKKKLEQSEELNKKFQKASMDFFEMINTIKK